MFANWKKNAEFGAYTTLPLIFFQYFCLECKLFDDENKEQYHCNGCGICRIGDQSKFFHCDGCNMCLPINLKGNHKVRNRG